MKNKNKKGEKKMRKYLYDKKETTKLEWFKSLKNASNTFCSLKRKLKTIKQNGFHRVWSIK